MGVGHPDYYRGVVPTFAQAITGQERYKYNEHGGLAGGFLVTNNIYTVPAGKRLYIGGISITCDHSCIQVFRLFVAGYQVLAFEYDIERNVNFPTGCGIWLEAGETLTRVIVNNDTIFDWFFIDIYGYLVDI